MTILQPHQPSGDIWRFLLAIALPPTDRLFCHHISGIAADLTAARDLAQKGLFEAAGELHVSHA